MDVPDNGNSIVGPTSEGTNKQEHSTEQFKKTITYVLNPKPAQQTVTFKRSRIMRSWGNAHYVKKPPKDVNGYQLGTSLVWLPVEYLELHLSEAEWNSLPYRCRVQEVKVKVTPIRSNVFFNTNASSTVWTNSTQTIFGYHSVGFNKSDSSLISNKNKDPLSHLRLIVPPSHIALSGDLHIQITGNLSLISPPNLVLDISRQEDDLHVVLLTTIQVLPDARTINNSTIIKLPCGLFSKGGPYILHLTLRQNDVMNYTDEDIGISKELDVRWPSPRLSLTPENIQTYPERPVTAILEFPEVICPPVSEKVPTAIPEFWLELHFCGPSLVTCDDRRQTAPSANITSTSTTQILYSEQVRGFPGRRVVSLRCELFGLAGYYALLLRPTSTAMPSVTSTAVYLKADWSEQFVFNVHARSIFPCDSLSGGIRVLFQYPACILQTGDRIRLYAKLRADVASLVPPTSLEYVVEQRFTRGQHSLYFDCDLFVERYVEYCFVYVSQALTGAVADVRQDCVPTLPVSESETGGWSEWSEWTPCTTTCAGGTRNRHRFCDSPPPRYGAKFCEGPAVETEKCGNGEGATDWECMYGGGNSVIGDVPADRPEVKAEIGPGCRCGCVVHLGKSKPRRLVATSSQSCPGRTFWLIQADHDHVIRFKVDHFRLPCGSQWLKVRDGSSLSSRLISQLVGTPYNAPPAVISTGPYLLLEFFSDELMAAGEICGGGFLAHAQQILHVNSSNMIPVAQGAVLMASVPPTPVKLTTVHVVALIFIFVVFVVSAGLIIQYILRYRKYQIAEDLDSFADISGSESVGNVAIPVRTNSSSTLLSEVISLTRLRPRLKKPNNKHIRLRESVDCEATLAKEEVIDEDSDTPIEDNESAASTTTLKDHEVTTTALITTSAIQHMNDRTGDEPIKLPSPSETTDTTSIPNSPKTSPLKRSNTFSSPGGSPNHHTNNKHKSKSGNVTPACGDIEIDVEKRVHTIIRRHSNVSNLTLTNGCYSPALSTVSRATIRTTSNPKENKEKRNRERLLAGPGSDFSLVGPDNDLELDYYDYNVVNAGAAPGSYLGMDPAFLVWIPPLDDSGEILNEIEMYTPQIKYEDIRPKQYINPGSNTESPEEEMVLPPTIRKPVEILTNTNVEIKRKRIDMNRDRNTNNKLIIDNISSSSKESLSTPLSEFKKYSDRKLKCDQINKKEKEISLEKSNELCEEYCETDVMLEEEIKFADDDEDDDEMDNNMKAKEKLLNTYQQDSNILSN